MLRTASTKSCNINRRFSPNMVSQGLYFFTPLNPPWRDAFNGGILVLIRPLLHTPEKEITLPYCGKHRKWDFELEFLSIFQKLTFQMRFSHQPIRKPADIFPYLESTQFSGSSDIWYILFWSSSQKIGFTCYISI